MEHDVNHSLERRRDARDQSHEVIAQTTNMSVEMAKTIIRFQADFAMTWANNIQSLTRGWVAQLDAFTQDAERVAQYNQQQYQPGQR